MLCINLCRGISTIPAIASAPSWRCAVFVGAEVTDVVVNVVPRHIKYAHAKGESEALVVIDDRRSEAFLAVGIVPRVPILSNGGPYVKQWGTVC